MRHTISTLPYPLNRLPHVSPNNVGHLELKNPNKIFFFGQPIEMFGVWGLGIVKGLENAFPEIFYMSRSKYLYILLAK